MSLRPGACLCVSPRDPGGGGAPDGVVREPGDHGPECEGDQADLGPIMMVTRAQVCRGREQRNYESRGARARAADTDPVRESLSLPLPPTRVITGPL